jgi:hypothetical protein
MQIYVDSKSAFLVHAASLNTNLSMSNGSHFISVQAWDTVGHVYLSQFSVTVGGSGTPAPPTPTGPGKVFSVIEQRPGWQSCSSCAGAGGHGPIAPYGAKQFVAAPSENGRAMQFSLGGGTPYSDALWWNELGANNGASNFRYDVDFYLTAPQSAQALEFDVNQSNGSHKFIFGTQCNIKGDHVWDVWDTAHHTWRPTGVGCSMPSAYAWHHLTWEFSRDGGNTHFVAVTLDGVKHYVNATYAAMPMGANQIDVAFQMDGDFAQHNYSAWLNGVTLTYW